ICGDGAPAVRFDAIVPVGICAACAGADGRYSELHVDSTGGTNQRSEVVGRMERTMKAMRWAVFVGALAMLSIPLEAQPRAGKAVPRAADGHPDVEGIWTNATITPVERPAALAGKATLSDDEARAFEKKEEDELQAQDGASDGPLIAAAGSSGTGGYNVL